MSVDIGALTVSCVYLAILTVRAIVRLVRGQAAIPFTGIGAVVLWSVLLTLGTYHEVRHHVVQAAATQATREVSGNPEANVTCRRVGQDWAMIGRELGFVSWDAADTAVLRQATCANLGTWMWGGRGHRDLAQVTAVHVVTHEAVHVAGVRNEAITECIALTLDAQVARTLGAGPEKADKVALAYLRVVYPRMGVDYTTDCSQVDMEAALAAGHP